MSKNFVSREDAINQLYETIKSKFEQDGVLKEVRCMLQSKMVSMMKGKNEPVTLVPRPSSSAGGIGDDAQSDPRLQLLNQLIMEYFQWHGFHYSAEMFSIESSCEPKAPMRECMEGILGNFEHKDLPILLEIIAELMEKHKVATT